MNYTRYRKIAKTGDCVLFSGKGRTSASIKWLTASKWSHVGMIICDRIYDHVLVWESTTLSNLIDIDTDSYVKGVQVVPLSLRLSTYISDVGVRPLTSALETDQIGSLMRLRKTFTGRPYEENFLELICSAYDGPGGENTEDLQSLFCSELVAEAYQRIGFLDEEKPSNEYTPADFAEDPVFGGFLKRIEVIER